MEEKGGKEMGRLGRVAGHGPRVVCERFLENRCMLREAQQGAKRPLDQLGVLGGAVSPQAGFRAAPRKFLKILKI